MPAFLKLEESSSIEERAKERSLVRVSSSWDLSRWCGLAAMVGGVLWAAQNVLVLAVEEIRWIEGVFLVALLLVLAGVVGFHFLQQDRYGPIGRTRLWAIFGATVIQEVGLLIFIFGDATLFWLVSPVGYVAMIVGYVLFGAATLQAGVLPRWCGLALLLGEPVTYLLGDYGGIVFGLMWVALGYVLWSFRGISAEQPAPRVR